MPTAPEARIAFITAPDADSALHEDAEHLLIAKTTHDCVEALAKRLEVIHSYAPPELVALTPSGGSERVLAWVRDECESR